MKKQKILYIADGNSLHDIKWISHFSAQQNKFSCYLLCESISKLSKETKTMLESKHITLLPQISPFSITSPIETWLAIRQFKKTVKELQPDLIHVLFATPHALWLNFTKAPSIITMRGSDILLVIPNLLKETGLKKIYFSFLYRRFRSAFLNARFVTGTSSLQIEKTKELFNIENLKLVRTGVDVDVINQYEQSELIPDSLKNKEFVFSPRFMSPIYNVSFQIDTISLLDREYIERFTFVFIRGKQFDVNYYQAQLKRLEYLKNEINLNYLIFDYLDQPTMWTLMKKASLCMMTPISDGTPNSALEAMAAKCPLIVSNLNYDSDLFDNTCIKLKSFEVTEFKDVIEGALTKYNPELVVNAFKQVSKFGNRNDEMNKLEQLYNLIAK
jgi:glycosyltransferase involved in cell wall biosynthesis